MFQSFESIGTDTKPHEKGAKRVCVGILTVVLPGKDSSIEMQVKQNDHQEYPTPCASLRGKKKEQQKKKLQRIRAYREKKKKNKKISYRPHLQAIMHEFFQMKNKIEFTSLKVRFISFFCKMFKIFYLLFSDFESLFICPVFFSTQER